MEHKTLQVAWERAHWQALAVAERTCGAAHMFEVYIAAAAAEVEHKLRTCQAVHTAVTVQGEHNHGVPAHIVIRSEVFLHGRTDVGEDCASNCWVDHYSDC